MGLTVVCFINHIFLILYSCLFFPFFYLCVFFGWLTKRLNDPRVFNTYRWKQINNNRTDNNNNDNNKQL